MIKEGRNITLESVLTPDTVTQSDCCLDSSAAEWCGGPAKLYSLEIVYNSINKYQLSGNKSPSILPINYPCGIIYCKLHFQRIANHVSSYYTCTQTHMGTCQSVDCNSFLTSLWSRRTTIMILVCKQRNGDFRKFCEHLRLIYPSPGSLATGLAFPSCAPLSFVGGCSYWF